MPVINRYILVFEIQIGWGGWGNVPVEDIGVERSLEEGIVLEVVLRNLERNRQRCAPEVERIRIGF